MKRLHALAFVIACLTIGWSSGPLAQSAEAEAKQDAADIARLVELLEIRSGSVVADVGTAGGALSLLLSPIVGPTGRVFATDINKDRITEINAAVGKADARNITVVLGDANRTNLPDGCCDAIFMRHVYHHFGDPPRMNQSLLDGLKPGGRIAVADFLPTSKKSAPPGQRGNGDDHGIMPETVIQELKAAGFDNPHEETWARPRGFLVVAEKRR
ncbi:MAG TPA: methyltransferase domain-containing protein [Vicinamibacterales bacterium]|nr:methyltransferase domain-containing protein [Vicinamibacterales bacterium]